MCRYASGKYGGQGRKIPTADVIVGPGPTGRMQYILGNRPEGGFLSSEKSRGITTFVTNEGAFRLKVLMFGLKTASEIFQKVMTQIVLKGLEGVM